MIKEILENQTGLDLVNNLFASPDYISNIYIDNPTFDINKMQQNLEITYSGLTEPNQDIFDIENNDYLFINGDAEVYSLNTTLTLPVGVYSFSGYSEYYGISYVRNLSDNKAFFLTDTENTIKIYEANSLVELWVENY